MNIAVNNVHFCMVPCTHNLLCSFIYISLYWTIPHEFLFKDEAGFNLAKVRRRGLKELWPQSYYECPRTTSQCALQGGPPPRQLRFSEQGPHTLDARLQHIVTSRRPNVSRADNPSGTMCISTHWLWHKSAFIAIHNCSVYVLYSVYYLLRSVNKGDLRKVHLTRQQ